MCRPRVLVCASSTATPTHMLQVRPGIVSKEDGKTVMSPLFSRVVSLCAEKNSLQYAVPGGLIGNTPFTVPLTRSQSDACV